MRGSVVHQVCPCSFKHLPHAEGSDEPGIPVYSRFGSSGWPVSSMYEVRFNSLATNRNLRLLRAG